MNRSRDRRRGHADQAARRALAAWVATGQAECPRCGQAIDPDQPWDAGHATSLAEGGRPDGPLRPEHASCNRSAGGQLAAELRRGRRVDRSRFLG
jgi:hypothetical protein